MAAQLMLSYPYPHIGLLVIDHPPANSLSSRVKERFETVLTELELNTKLRALVLTGTGNKFCTGDDLKEAVQNIDNQDKIAANLQRFGRLMKRVESLPFPTVAAINGWCIGGGLELALCCDIRMAVAEARFVCAGVNVGLIASGHRLPRTVGLGWSKRLLYTGEAMDAKRALSIGLITDLVLSEDLMESAMQLARTIAQKSPSAVRATKYVVDEFFIGTGATAQELEENLLLDLAAAEDYRKALTAFSKKETPNF